jgi:deazaflavin-dependent oxidoreductase (nitroreductase family)
MTRVNRAFFNPIQLRYAWLLPPWAVIVHRGRRSGRTYRTPVNAYRRGNVLAAVVMYGEQSDWVQNVLAGGGSVIRGGRTYELRDVQLFATEELPSWTPIPARVLGRLSGLVLVGILDRVS